MGFQQCLHTFQWQFPSHSLKCTIKKVWQWIQTVVKTSYEGNMRFRVVTQSLKVNIFTYTYVQWYSHIVICLYFATKMLDCRSRGCLQWLFILTLNILILFKYYYILPGWFAGWFEYSKSFLQRECFCWKREVCTPTNSH